MVAPARTTAERCCSASSPRSPLAVLYGGVILLRSHWSGEGTSGIGGLKVASVVQPSDTRAGRPGDLLFGMASPLTGPSKELGRAMRTGVEVAFAAANEAGGVHGRKLQLVALDDGYEPTRTVGVMKELAEQRKVFGFIGNVGTPTAAVAVPYAWSTRCSSSVRSRARRSCARTRPTATCSTTAPATQRRPRRSSSTSST